MDGWMDGWAVWFSQNAMWAFSEWAEERGLERASILAPLHTQFTYIFHFMSVRFFPSFLQDQSFLRLRFAKRAFATKNAIHTRTRVGLPSHSLHSVGRAVFALQMHFHITHEGRTRTRGEEEGRKEGRRGREEPVQKSLTHRIQNGGERRGEQRWSFECGAEIRERSSIGRGSKRGGRRRRRGGGGCAKGARSRTGAGGPTVTKDRLRRGRGR